MSDVLVFVPAWNEEASLPAVLDELAHDLPGADVFVVDDGSLTPRQRWRVSAAPRSKASPRTAG